MAAKEHAPAEKIKVRINGKVKDLDPYTVSDLLDTYRINPATIVVELNRQIIEKARYSSIRLREGDSVEIVHFVGGGAA